MKIHKFDRFTFAQGMSSQKEKYIFFVGVLFGCHCAKSKKNVISNIVKKALKKNENEREINPNEVGPVDQQ